MRSHRKLERSFVNGPFHDIKHISKLRELTAPHIDSFNFFIDSGLQIAAKSIPYAEEVLYPPEISKEKEESSTEVRIWYESATLGYPTSKDSFLKKIIPRECRERGLTYSAPLQATVCISINEGKPVQLHCKLGDCPIMVRSNRCVLRNLGPRQLSALKEEAGEIGGYFIVSGYERMIRMLQVPRRNVAQAIQRSSFKRRGSDYSDLGVSIRCARHDQTTVTVTLHYLASGGVTLRWSMRKQEFLVPVVIVLRALRDISDRELYDRVMAQDTADQTLADQLEVLLHDASESKYYTRKDCLAFLGERFRSMLNVGNCSNEDAGTFVIERYVLVHLSQKIDKQEMLLHMLRKLLKFVQGACLEENADALSSHELLLPGHLYCAYLKEKMEETLYKFRVHLLRDSRRNFNACIDILKDLKEVKKAFDRYGKSIGGKLATFLATGNALSTTGLDLMQVSGFTIQAERINMLRYLSHFRSVHRGSFFTTMKTTTVRKLLPESWGFLCPVHTPDGTPCGLLNHLAAKCKVVACNAGPKAVEEVEQAVIALGVTPSGCTRVVLCHNHGLLLNSLLSWKTDTIPPYYTLFGVCGGEGGALPEKFLPVLLNGRVLGGAPQEILYHVSKELRVMKVNATPGCGVDPLLEVAFIPPIKDECIGPYPGLYLSTDAARMVRPVLQLFSGQTEWIGPMEQPFINIACIKEDIHEGITTHRELDATNILSFVASLTPFSDNNQSPRNMYQCQMGKQSMGTPAHSLTPHKTDNKMYRLLCPQASLVQTQRYAEYGMDEYPQGMNAIVAVISYTGYSMEDAMILNKSSYERGFAHASVLKTFSVDLFDMASKGGTAVSKTSLRFKNTPAKLNLSKQQKVQNRLLHSSLDVDGLPTVGLWVEEGDPICSVVDEETGKETTVKHKESERATVETIRALGRTGANDGPLSHISVTLRFPRNPIIGDKFSSRHGQKGVLSILWPQEDMPFSESGMSPDIIINPHAFPSRMTIGMLIESMAGKSGALHGHYQDATPFNFHEKNSVVDHFGKELRAAGYAYYGSEPLYSGITGTVLHADIFMGVVYYQRLRHMVSDKSQARATGAPVRLRLVTASLHMSTLNSTITGAVDQLTRQPVQGRKRGGGVRFGEMERDSLLSHGAAFLIQDRLMNCSDRHIAHVCSNCGSMLSTCLRPSFLGAVGRTERAAAAIGNTSMAQGFSELYCSACDRSSQQKNGLEDITVASPSIASVAMPYVFRYLANELAAMNVKLTLSIRENC